MENILQNPNQPEQYPVPQLEPTGSNPIPHSPKKLLISLLMLATLIAGYFGLAKYQSWWPFGEVSVSPSPSVSLVPNSNTSSWKTYRNTDYGFEFKYPADHTAYASVDYKKEKLIPANSTVENDQPAVEFSVTIAENEAHVFCCEPITLSFHFATMTSSTEWLQYNAHGENKSSIKFAGQDAVQFIGTGSIDSIYKIILIDRPEALLEIKQTSQSQLLDQVLSTFKFTR